MADDDYVEDVAQLFHETADEVVYGMFARHYQFPEDQFNRVCAQMKTAQTWEPFLRDTYRNFNGRGRVLKKQNEPNAPGYRRRLVYERGDFAVHELWRFVDIFVLYLERALLFPAIDFEVGNVINGLLENVRQPPDWDLPDHGLATH